MEVQVAGLHAPFVWTNNKKGGEDPSWEKRRNYQQGFCKIKYCKKYSNYKWVACVSPFSIARQVIDTLQKKEGHFVLFVGNSEKRSTCDWYSKW